MVYRFPPFKFNFLRTTRQTRRYIINELDTVPDDKVNPQIPFMIREKHYRIKSTVDNTLAGQLFKHTFAVTRVIRDERIVLTYNRATEIRPYVERLIVEAMRFGDCHKPTMDMANYWLRDKALIHKLFKELVPRFESYTGAFTAIHPLGINYSHYGKTMTELKESRFSLGGKPEAVLELRGNPLPPIVRPKLNHKSLLSNVLIDGARLDYAMSMAKTETMKTSSQ